VNIWVCGIVWKSEPTGKLNLVRTRENGNERMKDERTITSKIAMKNAKNIIF